MIVAFTDHLLCLITLHLVAICWKRTVRVPFTLFSFASSWCHIFMGTVIVAFTNHLLCLVSSLPLGAIFLDENCDSGIY